MRATLRSLWTWTVIATLILVWVPVLALVRLFDRDPARYTTGRLFRRLGAALTRVNPDWHVEVLGDIPEDPRHPYVVVCNHQSMADIPIVSRLPWEMKWVAKEELFRVPAVGTMMKLAGDIPVDRTNPRSGGQALVAARNYLQHRCSVMFFPEGTRSKDGRLLPFTDGAFRLAIKQGVPILPLALDGAVDALPKETWKFNHASNIRVKVLPPVPTAGLTAADTGALREQVRTMIAEQLAAWRGTSVADVDGGVPDAAPPPVATRTA